MPALTRLWDHRFAIAQLAVASLLVVVYFGSGSLLQKALATLATAAALFLLDLGRRPALSIKALRRKSVAPSSAEHRGACELVLLHLHEPILSIQTRNEIRSREQEVLDPGSGEFLRCCEFFLHDLRIQTGWQWAPLAGRGHFVSLRLGSEGNWEIVDTGSWVS